MQLARNILQLFLLTPAHVRLHANPFSLVDTVDQRNLIFYLWLNESSQVFIFATDGGQGRHEYLCVAH